MEYCVWCRNEIPVRKKHYYTSQFYKQRYEGCCSGHVQKAERYMQLIHDRYPELSLYETVEWRVNTCPLNKIIIYDRYFWAFDKSLDVIGWEYTPCYIEKMKRGDSIEQHHLCDLVKLGHKYEKMALKDFVPKEIKVDLPVQRHILPFQQVNLVEFSILL